jgi:light-harvesting complex I chlorophyll a/b binding protein 1/light-harvesting complex I chlorophyll a/b binding protein 4
MVQQFITLPGMTHVDDQTLTPGVVGVGPMLQIVVGCGVMEFWSNKGKVTMEDMFSDPSRVPGNLGFDPMGFSKNKSKEEMEKLELQELKNARLAMLAIGMSIYKWMDYRACLYVKCAVN